MTRVLVAAIRGYQGALSPLLPPSCRFQPSCSQYAIDAVRHRGALLGSLLTIRRLLRCNPWNAGGYDPALPDHTPASLPEVAP